MSPNGSERMGRAASSFQDAPRPFGPRFLPQFRSTPPAVLRLRILPQLWSPARPHSVDAVPPFLANSLCFAVSRGDSRTRSLPRCMAAMPIPFPLEISAWTVVNVLVEGLDRVHFRNAPQSALSVASASVAVAVSVATNSALCRFDIHRLRCFHRFRVFRRFQSHRPRRFVPPPPPSSIGYAAAHCITTAQRQRVRSFPLSAVRHVAE